MQNEPITTPSPIGILGVVQTPFTKGNEIDWESLDRLIHDALASGADGFLVPAVASENAHLSINEKLSLASRVQEMASRHVPVFWGAGSFDPEVCIEVANAALDMGAAACLVAVPPVLYENPEEIEPFFAFIASRTECPLMIQDLEFGGPGMPIDVIRRLFESIDTFRYLKVETVPAGPKYSAVLDATGGRLHVSGGWAVQQMIEALDRGVHAMIPECSMIRIYKQIDTLYRGGNREAARRLFNRLLPVLAFTNQQLDVSIRFFKRLLVRKGIFATAADRLDSAPFDAPMERIVEELIDYELELEKELK